MRISDWSSDVCSSALTSAPDLIVTGAIGAKGGSGEGHAARAIDIAAGATVTHLTNSGAITASTSGKGVATAIHDGAGGLSLIENSGAIGASASDTTAQAIAIDLTANNPGATIKQHLCEEGAAPATERSEARRVGEEDVGTGGTGW